MKNKVIQKLTAVITLGLFAQVGLAVELESLAWESESDQAKLKIMVNGAAEYETQSLDSGQRMRIVLPGIGLGRDAVDISGRGPIKGVFPYISDDGRSVFIDFLMRNPHELLVEKTSYGFEVRPATATMVAASDTETSMTAESTTAESTTTASESTSTEQTNTQIATNSNSELTDVTFTTLPGGRIQINLTTNGRPGEPGTFSTNRPPRIAFDFFGMRNSLKENVVKIGSGALESIAVVETDDRTRVVLNLVRPVPYELQVKDGGVVLLVQNPETAGATVSQTKPKAFQTKSDTAEHSIKRIDFRRSKEGGGRIIVNLSDANVGVDVRDEGGEIIIDFPDTKLPAELEQRLDVIDFATPVQTVDTFQQGNTVRMVVTPTGRFQHLAYQSGNIFNLNVDQIVEDEEEKEVDEFGYSGERLSLNFQKISVRAALQVIADFTGLNFVTSDSVTGTLTLRLKEVPWDQALDIILQTRGLGKRQKGNVVWVAPAEEIAARERAELEASKQIGELEPLVSELVQVNYAKASDIAALLKSVKSVDTGIEQSLFGSVSIATLETESNSLLSPRGNVTVDERTNSILIQDTSRKISEVRKLIAKLDTPVRQVLIETRIVEATDNFSRALGARLGFSSITRQAQVGGSGNIGDVFVSGNLENTATIAAGGLSTAGTDALNVDLATPGIGNDSAATYAISIAKAGLGFSHIIDLEISALESKGEGKVIANPRLITANLKEAHIEQGQERIFTTSVLGVGDVVTEEAVLGLTVTPQITPDDRIILDVFITQDNFVSPTDPTINKKEISTQVLLDNGETIVIGGIYQQDVQTNVAKVPLLGDLPLIGNLFKKRSKQDNRTELLIFLTPKIISPGLNLGASPNNAFPVTNISKNQSNVDYAVPYS